MLCQEDERCIVRAIESLLKTKKSMKAALFKDLPTVKKVLARVQQDDGSVTYQTAELKMHDQCS